VTTPLTPAADARNRALRTVLQGLVLDVSVAVVLVLATSVGDLHWTRAYWLTLGLTLAKTVIQSGVAYAMRKLIPPGKEPIG
jgi:hypothetical protein